jgi:hypothetical protein
VVDGESWVRELGGSGPVRPAGRQNGPVEFGQRLISPALLQEFKEIQPDQYQKRIADAVLLMQTAEGGGDPLGAELGHIENLERKVVADASPWLEDPSIWSGLVPAKAVAAIVEWLVKR